MGLERKNLSKNPVGSLGPRVGNWDLTIDNLGPIGSQVLENQVL